MPFKDNSIASYNIEELYKSILCSPLEKEMLMIIRKQLLSMYGLPSDYIFEFEKPKTIQEELDV